MPTWLQHFSMIIALNVYFHSSLLHKFRLVTIFQKSAFLKILFLFIFDNCRKLTKSSILRHEFTINFTYYRNATPCTNICASAENCHCSCFHPHWRNQKSHEVQFSNFLLALVWSKSWLGSFATRRLPVFTVLYNWVEEARRSFLIHIFALVVSEGRR